MEFIHWSRPYWFLALIPALLMLLALSRYLIKGNNWQNIIDAPLLQHLLIFPDAKKHYWPLVLLGLMWLIAVLALAGPAWDKRIQPVYQNQSAKVILLDLSHSMLAQDITPNRLTRAQYKILDILNNYREGQTGMAVFSSEAYTVSPLTFDTHTIALMVPDLSPNIMPVSGSNIGVGLDKAKQLLQQGGVKSGTIVLITDSVPTPADDKIAEQIHADGYTVSVLGIGTIQGAPIPTDNNFETQQGKPILTKLDIPGLEQLAEAGGGRFSTFTDSDADIHYLLSPTVNNVNAGINKAKEHSNINLWIDEGRWFILLLLPLALLAFRRGGFMEVSK